MNLTCFIVGLFLGVSITYFIMANYEINVTVRNKKTRERIYSNYSCGRREY